MLPDNSVLTVDCIGQPANGPDAAERYLPASNTWISAGSTPAGHNNLVEASSQEIGPALLLPDGNVLYVGAPPAIPPCIPPPVPAARPWLAGPDLPNVLDSQRQRQTPYNTYVRAQCKDAPGVLEVNGKVLVVAGPDRLNATRTAAATRATGSTSSSTTPTAGRERHHSVRRLPTGRLGLRQRGL